MMNPTTIPNPYPTATGFQVKPLSPGSTSLSWQTMGEFTFSQFLDNGEPHNSGFSSKDELEKVLNCLPRGIGPVS